MVHIVVPHVEVHQVEVTTHDLKMAVMIMQVEHGNQIDQIVVVEVVAVVVVVAVVAVIGMTNVIK
jgi:hypothetical protein